MSEQTSKHDGFQRLHEIPFNRPTLLANEVRYLREAIERQQLSGDGHFTKLCSARLKEQTGAAAVLLTHSCTAALELAAMLCDLKKGDEVIMPSYTFVSTANAVVLRGATPVFVDIDPLTLNIASKLIEEAITPRTKAIFVVHYAGIPADMDEILELARVHGLLVVEDAAQALGSTYRGKAVGALGDLGAFSFHETKNIISGEGGALTVVRPNLVERAEILREKGTDRSRFLRGEVDKYTWVDIGSSFLPGELVASFLFAQIEMMDMVKARRMAMFERYSEAFADISKTGRVQIPHCPEDRTGNGHMFYLIMQSPDERERFIAHMREREIMTPFHYVPLHSAPAGKRYARTSGDLSVTDDLSARLVRMPMFFDLGIDIEHVIAEARGFFGVNRDI
ncbi:MAG: dTDP-4-amino-4,6-dideoxygalactose transaminase [Boseongicola sp.]